MFAKCHRWGLRKLCCRFWPVREYPWGSCEALSSRHSDLAALKKLLFEVNPAFLAQARVVFPLIFLLLAPLVSQ